MPVITDFVLEFILPKQEEDKRRIVLIAGTRLTDPLGAPINDVADAMYVRGSGNWGEIGPASGVLTPRAISDEFATVEARLSNIERQMGILTQSVERLYNALNDTKAGDLAPMARRSGDAGHL